MSIADFYDSLAPYYHLIYPDWDASITRQSTALDVLIKERWPDAIRVLDVACGIGTQSIGLSERGYSVSASDISPASILRAKDEAISRGLDISFVIADMRHAYSTHQASFDVALACDNAIAHLLTDDDICNALRELYRCINVGGGCIISLRDYDTLEKTGLQVKSYGIREEGSIRYMLWQVWDFEGDIYNQDLYLLEDNGGTECRTHVMRSRSYAVSPNRLVELMHDVGFTDVVRLDERFFQPLVIGTRSV